ncbi:MAG: hypothetical protein JWM02_3371 [Frankiales bacterium]|nr:hypothetical protein [Frankiales bacterium]
MQDLSLCGPPPEQDCGWSELPDVIPDWVLEQYPLPEPLPCDCGCACTSQGTAVAEEAPQRLIPGVTGRAPTPVLPAVSDVVAAVQTTVRRLEAVDPACLPGAQALADGQALLVVEQQLRVLNLRRVSDVAARGLHELVGFRSAKSWLRTYRPDGDAADAALASQLRDFTLVREAVDTGRVPLAGARKVLLALRKVAPHVDRPDGLIDGQPGDEVVTAVVRHVLALVCRSMLGLADEDPRLVALVDRAKQVLAAGSQLDVLEAALTWLAEELPARHLAGPLDEVVMALLPSKLEERGELGGRRRGLSLTPLEDGTGWHLCGDLDLECGEQLWAALGSEAARDPHNPQDTAAWADATREDKDAWQVGAELAGSEHPRNRRERLHDALQRLLGRYLEHGLGGTAGKVPVQVHVTLTEPTVSGAPGAPPPRTDSGRLVPRALVRRWWCDSSITAFVLSLGGRALRVVHSQRTLTADERRALAVEGGDRCVGDGCCSGLPDPLVAIRPHHTTGYAEDQITCLDETLPVCDVLHRDLHEGHKTVRLRDGRYLKEHGFVDEPSLDDEPPF